MTNDIEILGIRGDELTFLHNGRRCNWKGSTATASVAVLRVLADSHEARAEDLARRAAVVRAAADFKEAQELTAKTAANKQRNERAAATRAKNKDPFGFNAAYGWGL